jgi:hypothetical protein
MNYAKVFSWQRVLLGALVLHILARHSPSSLGLLLKMLLWGGLALRLSLELPLALQRVRQAQQASLISRWRAFCPPFLLAQSHWQWNLLQACAAYFVRRPHPTSQPSGQTFTVLKKSQYGTMFAMFVLSLLVDLPVSMLFIGLLEHDPAKRQLIHAIILVLSLYAFLLILGDRFLLPLSGHAVDEKLLRLRISQRFAADIPLVNIVAVQRFDEAPDKWARQKKYQQYDDYVIVSPTKMFDAPNVLLELRESEEITMECNCLVQPMPRFVLLYLDQPQDLIHRLAAVKTD